MPFTPVNFLQAETQTSPFEGLIESALEGYKASRIPKELRQKEQERELANRLQQENVEREQTRNRYLPGKLEHQEYKNEVDKEFLRPNAELAHKTNEAKLKEQQIKTLVQEKYGLSDAESDSIAKAISNQTSILSNKKAQKELDYFDELRRSEIDKNVAAAEKSRNPSLSQKPTKAQQNAAAAGLVEGSPEYRQVMRHAAGLASERETPPNTRPFEDMPTNERLDAAKRMRNVVNSYAKVKQVQKNLVEMKKIIKNNPGIAGSLGAAFIDPNDPGVKSILASWWTSKKDIADIQKMKKLAADINLNELSSFGQNISDARQKLIEVTKASPNLEPSVIEYIIDKVLDQKEPYEAFVEATREGLNGNYEVYDDPEAFRLENMSPEMLEWYKKKLSSKEGK
jgi:hypothetical protein